MVTGLSLLSDSYKGPWCDENLAALQKDDDDDSADKEYYGSFLRELWASALMRGDLKSAHRLWGKWQSIVGEDPWEDPGWRNFWELQRLGESFWDDFDAGKAGEFLLLRSFISYWPGLEFE